ncbi:HNH/endonuclease VII fold putative polymorphic toxin [Pseudomonas sp. 7P_10.2_Bac1]|uniref:RHS repeat-associated core domain-containing protein n=1 Tax=Pseudomonas sp. 7P_10.2_Bac1 TaxID=2971614 RepID=UPI0021C60EEE|nr:RHS repeat-associated core domain-containing protein [Pseudomonas sp. 7P_10.2_Bac1]MCU1727097.1 HNH/endonuclease VII fold putative polymorphic toxin [Pseudomonas sp. 7P_10.2_Bac1]
MISIGSMFMSMDASQPDINKVLEELKHCIEGSEAKKGYRDHADAWYGGMLDAEQSFRVGDEVHTQDKDNQAPVKLFAQCQRNSTLTLIHAFEAARFIPIGNTRVRMVPMGGGPEIDTVIDASGVQRIENCLPDRNYQITFYPQITTEQLDTFFASYQDLLNDLSQWLRTQWDTEYFPLWQTHQEAGELGRVWIDIQSQWNGLIKTLIGLWDDIKGIFSLISDPKKNYEKLKKFFTEEQYKLLLSASTEALQTALLIASDEPLMWAYLSALTAWIKILPPQIRSEILARITTELLINILLGVVLSGGIGLATRLTIKGVGSAGKATQFLQDFVDLLMRTSKARSPHHATVGKPFYLQGEGRLDSGLKADVEIKPQNGEGAAQVIPDATVLARGKPQSKTTLEVAQHVDDAPSQSKTPNDKPAEPAKDTQTNGCPVSMVTGEELLTLTDGVLDGALALEWTRLYRTSAVEINGDLGFGWSHTLSHRLQRDGEELLWTDHENRQTRFPLPSRQRPAITNSLAKAAIYLGEHNDELILAQAGKNSRFYHFNDLQLSAISDAYGNRLKITYQAGRLHRIDNGAGRALLLRYADGRLCAVDYQQYDDSREFAERSNQHYAKRGIHLERWTTLHTQVTYQYNAAGQLISASNALQETEHYRYDAQHVIQERQLAGGATFYWQWQHAGKQARCIRHWANFGQMDATYEWDDQGSVTVKNRDGSQQVYVHDDNARLVSQIDPDGAEHHKAYDDKGRLIAEKDPLGAVTEYQYNEAGQLTALIPPTDEPTFYSYFNGHVRKVERGLASWKYERNAQGDITCQTDPDGNVTHYKYTAKGQLSGLYYPDGSQHTLTWNPLGQLLDETLPDGTQRRYRYDAQGRKITQQDERGAITQYQWDAANRLTQITLPGGKTRAWSYNAYGKVTAERDERGHITRYEYADNLHLISRRINPDGSQLNYRYDNARLLLTGIENERHEHYQLEYYSNGLIHQEIGFDGRKTAYAYDLKGQLLEKTEYPDAEYPNEEPLITAYQRDPAGRLISKTLPDGSEITYTYDTLGRLTAVDDGAWPLAYEYDLQDRLISEHQGWATLRYQYDTLGQLSDYRLPDGNRLHYRYQKGGALKAIDLNGKPLTGHRYEAGLETVRQQGYVVSHYQYDEQGRLQDHAVSQLNAHGDIDGQPLYRRNYRYDANGNLSLLSDSRKGHKSYAYDPLDRLTDVRGTLTEHFIHDPAGNLLDQSTDGPRHARYVNIKGNRLLMQGDSHFAYDAYGNLSQERRGAGQRITREYRYDSQQRLTGITLPDGSRVTYRYDAFGRRIAKDYGGITTQYLWQGERLIAESAQQKGLRGISHYSSYLYEPGTFKPLALLQGEGDAAQVYHYQLDHLGTPQELTDHRGQIVWSAHYRAYGNVLKFDKSEITNPLRFQGQYYDEESGLHYNRHRYYNPNTGRYLTPDPIKLAGGLNSYQYVPNPTGWVDPLGLSSCPGGDNTPACERPNELIPPEVSRNGAFKQAKLEAGIPRTQQPDSIYDPLTAETGQYKYVRMTSKNNESILNNEGKPILTREYQFTRADGSIIVIQDHSAGHRFSAPGNAGDQPAHLNLRPIENTRNGKVDGARDHYYFREKK